MPTKTVSSKKLQDLTIMQSVTQQHGMLPPWILWEVVLQHCGWPPLCPIKPTQYFHRKSQTLQSSLSLHADVLMVIAFHKHAMQGFRKEATDHDEEFTGSTP